MDTESVFNIVYEFKNNKVINEGLSWTLENRHIIENKILYRENGTRWNEGIIIQAQACKRVTCKVSDALKLHDLA